MRKRPLLILIALLAVLTVAVYIRQAGSPASASSESRDLETMTEIPSLSYSGTDEAESGELRTGPRANRSHMPSQPSETPEPKTYHSTVEAILEPGETLVMGGYRTEDGMHEFTMLTPRSVTLESGEVGIELRSQIISIDPEFAKQSGMDTLTTLANRNDWAEAWSAEDVRSTLHAASKTVGTLFIYTPKIKVSPGEASSIEFDRVNSDYRHDITANLTPEGKFSIHANFERAPRTEP